jgi:hypothetical protein
MPAGQASALVFGGIVTVMLFPSFSRLFLQPAAGTAQQGAAG